MTISISEYYDNIFELSYVKNYLKVDHTTDDQVITDIVHSIEAFVEQEIGFIISKKQFSYKIIAKNLEEIQLNLQPFVALNAIFLDELLITNNLYNLKFDDKYIKIVFYTKKNGNILVKYTSGHDKDSLSMDLFQAIMIHIVHCYENRMSDIFAPKASQEIYNKYKNIIL